MPKKSRKDRLKLKRWGPPQPLDTKPDGQFSQVLRISPTPASAGKSSVRADEQAARHQYVLSEMKRSLTIASVLLVLLIILYFLFRQGIILDYLKL
jgi:hypothetical protein